MSEDKSECVANKCSCVNGVELTGAQCVNDGAKACESCNAGFKLDSASSTCAGMFVERSGSQCCMHNKSVIMTAGM